VLVVEHDADVMRAADHIVDSGRARASWGQVTFSGNPEELPEWRAAERIADGRTCAASCARR
jgi:excinuclease UvrABC ATPase subunit